MSADPVDLTYGHLTDDDHGALHDAATRDAEMALLLSLLEQPHRRQAVVGRVEVTDMSDDLRARALDWLLSGPEDSVELLCRAARLDREVFSLLNDHYGGHVQRVQPWRARHYAELVRGAAVGRRLALITEAQRMALAGERATLPTGVTLMPGLPYEQITAMCAQAAQEVQAGTVDDSWQTLGEAAREALDDAQRTQDGEGSVYPTGLSGLDALLDGGFRPGQLVILSGRPGAGKTALALHMMRWWAEQIIGGSSGAVVSLEMTGRELAGRELAAASGIHGSRIRQGDLHTDDDWPRLLDAAARLDAYPVVLSRLRRVTAAQVRAALLPLRQRQRHGASWLQWLMLDYLTLLDEPPGSRTKTEGVGANSTELKAIAQEWGIPVICLAQMNRQAARDPGRMPRPDDLRDSGQIEQDADVILFVHQPPDGVEGERMLVLSKQRQGRRGVVPVTFDAGTMTWTDSELL